MCFVLQHQQLGDFASLVLEKSHKLKCFAIFCRYDNVPWNHHLPAVEPLLPPENNKENGEHSVKHASQLAGLVLLAVPLLLPCRVRLVGKHSSMLAEKRNTLLRSSTEKKETRKVKL